MDVHTDILMVMVYDFSLLSLFSLLLFASISGNSVIFCHFYAF